MQRRGIGTVLVHALLAVAEACEEPLVALLGAPSYYRRFGFVRSTDLGITPPDPTWGEHFQAAAAARAAAAGHASATPSRSRRLLRDQPRRRTWRWLTDICLPPGSGPPGTGMRRAAHGAHPAAEGVDLGGREVARQLHDVGAELAQRDLALVVADDDVVDRGVADDPGDLLLLLGEQAADPARARPRRPGSMPGPAEHPVHGVELGGAGDAGGDPPVAAHALEHPGGRARLALDLAVGRALGPAAEDDQRGEQRR